MAVFTLNFLSVKLHCHTDVTIVMPDFAGASRNPAYTGKEPADYFKDQKDLAVVYLLHGAGGDHNDWLRATPLEMIAQQRNLVFVCPNGMSSDYADISILWGGYDFPGYLFDELMPMMQNCYPITSDPAKTFICGFSMGGNGAIVLSLMRPHVFGCAGAFAGSLRDVDDLRPWASMTSAEFRVEGFDTTRFHGIYPPGFNQKEVNMIARYPTVGDFLASPENTWDRYLEVFEKGELPQLWVTVGSEDRCTGRVNKFKELAAKIGDTKTVFSEIPGHRHTYMMAAIALQNFLDYIAEK